MQKKLWRPLWLCLRSAVLMLVTGPLALMAQAQTFKIECDAEGISQPDNRKLTPAKISIEIQDRKLLFMGTSGLCEPVWPYPEPP